MNKELIETIGAAIGWAGMVLSMVMMFVQHRKREKRDRERYVRNALNRPTNVTFTLAPPLRRPVHQ